jgi:hypothetical protein
MTIRIPPSLSWLTKKRAHLAGELEKTKKSLKELHPPINAIFA